MVAFDRASGRQVFSTNGGYFIPERLHRRARLTGDSYAGNMNDSGFETHDQSVVLSATPTRRFQPSSNQALRPIFPARRPETWALLSGLRRQFVLWITDHNQAWWQDTSRPACRPAPATSTDQPAWALAFCQAVSGLLKQIRNSP
jgi:hypothetical protein